MRLPPLNAIRTFEVAARLESFALAGAELGVSSAAVSQQIRHLEAFFGKKLFIRNGNRLSLTDAGIAMYPQTATALEGLAAMTRRTLEGELRTRIVVSVPFSLAEAWLAPKLANLLLTRPQLSIDVRVEDDPVDLIRYNIDVRVSYGHHHYPSCRVWPLFHDEVIPVCSPYFWNQHGNLEHDLGFIHESHFIHTEWGASYASHPTWSDWFAAHHISTSPDPANGRRSGLSSLSITMARLGLGVALGQHALADRDLQEGRLLALSTATLKLGHAYSAFISQDRAASIDVQNFITLLQN